MICEEPFFESDGIPGTSKKYTFFCDSDISPVLESLCAPLYASVPGNCSMYCY